LDKGLKCSFKVWNSIVLKQNSVLFLVVIYCLHLGIVTQNKLLMLWLKIKEKKGERSVSAMLKEENLNPKQYMRILLFQIYLYY